MNEQQLYDDIYKVKEHLNELLNTYWQNYSDMGTWYFWVNLATFIIPLIILYFSIDRKRLFEICFFGYTVHVLWGYIDIALSKENFLVHPHTLFLFIPVGFTMTVSAIPVAYMLVYQYCTNREQNFYVYAVILSLIFAYGLGSISDYLDLFKMHKWNDAYIFVSN